MIKCQKKKDGCKMTHSQIDHAKVCISFPETAPINKAMKFSIEELQVMNFGRAENYATAFLEKRLAKNKEGVSLTIIEVKGIQNAYFL